MTHIHNGKIATIKILHLLRVIHVQKNHVISPHVRFKKVNLTADEGVTEFCRGWRVKV